MRLRMVNRKVSIGMGLLLGVGGGLAVAGMAGLATVLTARGVRSAGGWLARRLAPMAAGLQAGGRTLRGARDLTSDEIDGWERALRPPAGRRPEPLVWMEATPDPEVDDLDFLPPPPENGDRPAA
jgi:hypothetical protein